MGASYTGICKPELNEQQVWYDQQSWFPNQICMIPKKVRAIFLKKNTVDKKLMITLHPWNWAQKNQYFQAMNFTIDNAEQTIAYFYL